MIPKITISIQYCTRDSSHTIRQGKKGTKIEKEEIKVISLQMIQLST